MKHLIIDLETLDTCEKAVILQIAVAIHDTNDKETMLESLKFRTWKIRAAVQAEFGRTVSTDTLNWWKGQPLEVQKLALIPSSTDVDPEVVCEELVEWLRECKFTTKDMIWQRGSKDHDWVTSLMVDCGWTLNTIPMKFYRVRDVRTCVDVLGHSEKLNGYPDNAEELRAMIPGYKPHDALSDIRLELLILRQCGIL